MKNTRIYIAIALIFSCFIYFFGIKNLEEVKIDSLGTLGDFVGGNLNPILTFLSFLAILATVKLQSEEMALSREELKKSAQAQEDSKKILDQQYSNQIIQQFENTFFSLLQQIRDVAPDQRVVDFLISSDAFKSDIQTARNQVHRAHDNYSHYFRLIYQTLKFIKNKSTQHPAIEAKFYANILRSTLTPSQTKLLAVNSAILPKFKNDQYEFFRKLIEEYSLLEHMRFFNASGVADRISLQIYCCYKKTAFGDNNQIAKIEQTSPSIIQNEYENVKRL